MCYVYAIECGDYWKFGITSNHPDARCEEIQTGNPVKCTVYNYALYSSRESALFIEKLIHGFLYLYRERGEWFRKGAYSNTVANLLGLNELTMIIINEVEFQIDLDSCEDRKKALEQWACYWCRVFKTKEHESYSSLPWKTTYFSIELEEMHSKDCLLSKKDGFAKVSVHDLPNSVDESD